MRISDDEPRQSMMMMLISLSRIFVGRPFGILFSYDVPDVFGLSFSYLEHHPWLRFLVNKPEIATAPMSCPRELSILNDDTENLENLIKSLGSNLGNIRRPKLAYLLFIVSEIQAFELS